MKGKRILEVNPRHPLIQQVKDKFEAEPDNAANGALAKLLYETALLESGFPVRTAFICSLLLPCPALLPLCPSPSSTVSPMLLWHVIICCRLSWGTEQ